MPGMSNLHTKWNGKSCVESANGVLYSRWRDGADKVKITPTGFELIKPEAVLTFSSARQLLIAITGHPNARNWTFDRYFKTGRHTPNLALAHNQPSEPIFDLLVFDDITKTPSVGRIETSPDLTLPPNETSKFQGNPNFVTSVSSGGTLGVDLVNRAHEVAKLFYAGFGQRVYAAGYDPEDVLQEVYKGLLSRNTGTCPWDPAKSSFGHYVHMVAGCIVANYHRKMSRRRAVEQIGAPGWDHGDLTNIDVACSAVTNLLSNPLEGQEAAQTSNLEAQDLVSFIQSDPRIQSRDGRLALRLLPYVEEGYSRAEMSNLLQVSTNLVSRALALIRIIAQDWQHPPKSPRRRRLTSH